MLLFYFKYVEARNKKCSQLELEISCGTVKAIRESSAINHRRRAAGTSGNHLRKVVQ